MSTFGREARHLSINTATLRRQWSLPQIIEGVARAGINGISPWRDQIAACGLAKAARQIRLHGLTVTGLCRGGMFTGETAPDRRAALDANRRAVDEAAELGAACLVLVVGGLADGSRDIAAARGQVYDGLHELRDYALKAAVPLGIEPLHPIYAADRACVNTLSQANDLCDKLGDGVGIVLDTYHVWWDPDLARQIARAGKRLLAYHVSDWLVPTRDLLNDRGMMGDGVIDFRSVPARSRRRAMRASARWSCSPTTGGRARPTRSWQSASSAMQKCVEVSNRVSISAQSIDASIEAPWAADIPKTRFY